MHAHRIKIGIFNGSYYGSIVERMSTSSRFGKVNLPFKPQMSYTWLSSEFKKRTRNCAAVCVIFYFLEQKSISVIRFSKNLCEVYLSPIDAHINRLLWQLE